jgi:chemotaxis protein MotA
MLNGVGFIIVLVCVFGSFVISGGKFAIIMHALPHELMAIVGASVGAFIVANSFATVKKAGAGIVRSFKGSRWKSSDYRDLLTMLFGVLSTFKKNGATALEPHLDNPGESDLFTPYPRLLKDHHLIEFMCDYLRMMTVNFEDPHQLEAAMEADIEKHHHEEAGPQHALQIMADGLPAIGIVAAVLGVIKTMGSIDQPTQILGAMIGGALVGTFLGVLLDPGRDDRWRAGRYLPGHSAQLLPGRPARGEAQRDDRGRLQALFHREDRDRRLRPERTRAGRDRDRTPHDPFGARTDLPAT